MCGIAGLMTVDGSHPTAAALDGLEKALLHRRALEQERLARVSGEEPGRRDLDPAVR